MKSALIMVHLLIGAGSGFSLYALWGDLTHVQSEKSVIANPNLPDLFKPRNISIASSRPLFDVVPSTSASLSQDSNKGETGTEENERKKSTFQVKGIFISGTDRFALLEPDSQPDGAASLRKVTEGISLDEYVVSGIAPGSVRLKNSGSGESIRLKAFSRNGPTTDSADGISHGIMKSSDSRRTNQR